MTPRYWVSILVFLSAYAPLALIIAVQDYQFDKSHFEHPITVSSILALAFLSVVVLFVALRTIKAGDDVEIKSLTYQTGELVNYSVPYLVSLLSLNLGEIKAVLSFLIFFLIICILTIRTKLVFINPVLAAFGWNLYEVTYTRRLKEKTAVFLVNGELHNGETCTIQPLSQFLFIVTKLGPQD